MPILAFIFDFDNTIFPVPSIGHTLFAPLFGLIEGSGEHQQHLEELKDEIMRRPFQAVAADFGFSEQLTRQGIAMLETLTYNQPIEPFADYAATLQLPGLKFLVTTGFTNMQQSKIDQSGVRPHFDEVIVVDPMKTTETKKDVFEKLMQKYSLQPAEVLVIGDDPQSEIKAAQELGIDAVLYDPHGRHPNAGVRFVIKNFEELAHIAQQAL